MARPIDEVVSEATARPNPAGGNGLLLRSDIFDALEGIVDPEKRAVFDVLIDSCTFLSVLEKEKIKSDYVSY